MSSPSKSSVTLRNWSVHSDENLYQAPELKTIFLRGFVYGHPHVKDGQSISTSFVVGAEGLNIETNRHIYILEGDPNPGFVKYLKSIDYPFDPSNPVKVHSRKEVQYGS